MIACPSNQPGVHQSLVVVLIIVLLNIFFFFDGASQTTSVLSPKNSITLFNLRYPAHVNRTRPHTARTTPHSAKPAMSQIAAAGRVKSTKRGQVSTRKQPSHGSTLDCQHLQWGLAMLYNEPYTNHSSMESTLHRALVVQTQKGDWRLRKCYRLGTHQPGAQSVGGDAIRVSAQRRVLQGACGTRSTRYYYNNLSRRREHH